MNDVCRNRLIRNASDDTAILQMRNEVDEILAGGKTDLDD